MAAQKKNPRKYRNINRDVEVRRDENGIPHINANTLDDALYGLGYFHARDRLTQILFSRTVAEGRAAERIANKPSLVETDCFFRRLGLHRNLTEEAKQFPTPIFYQIQQYCDGVNDGIRSTGRSLPMWATGFQPRPWNIEAVLIVGKLLSFGGLAISQMQNERLLVELIHARADSAALRQIFSPRLDDVDFDLLQRVHMSNQLSDDALDLLTDLPRLAGSNAWAVSGEKTESGNAILASDPHLEINRLPAIWYEAVLNWGGDNFAMGATLPGCPLFAVARTNNLSWGVTYMKGDTVDFFIEDCKKHGENDWRYRRSDTWESFQHRTESIERKGAEPEVIDVYENDQGVLDSDPASHGDGMYLSVAWTGNHAIGDKAISTWIELLEAESTQRGMEIAKHCSQPTLCFVFADSDGHIGLQGSGTFPKRNDPTSGLVPLPAWDEKNHWQGWLSSDYLQTQYDPPEGFVATANEVFNPEEGPLLITQLLPDYRKRRIVERLADMHEISVKDMQELQYDLVSVQARDLLEVFLPSLPEGELKQKLENWDYRYAIDCEEASLFQRLYINVLMEVCGNEHVMGWRRALYICTRAGYSTMVLAALDRLLLSDDVPFWESLDKGQLIAQAAKKMADFQPIPWGERNYFQFINRFFDMPSVGRLFGFESKRLPMPGCHATIFQGHVLHTATREQTFAPSYHFVSDLGADEVWSNLPGGPSESRFSKFYQSDIARWIAGEYKCVAPMISDNDELLDS